MVKFLLIINQKGIVRLVREFNTRFEDTFFLNNELIYGIYQQLNNFKNKSRNYFQIHTAERDITIQYRQYASLYFIIGTENNDTKSIEENLILIHELVKEIDTSFQMKSCELDFIYEYDKINKIVDQMNFI